MDVHRKGTKIKNVFRYNGHAPVVFFLLTKSKEYFRYNDIKHLINEQSWEHSNFGLKKILVKKGFISEHRDINDKRIYYFSINKVAILQVLLSEFNQYITQCIIIPLKKEFRLFQKYSQQKEDIESKIVYLGRLKKFEDEESIRKSKFVTKKIFEEIQKYDNLLPLVMFVNTNEIEFSNVMSDMHIRLKQIPKLSFEEKYKLIKEVMDLIEHTPELSNLPFFTYHLSKSITPIFLSYPIDDFWILFKIIIMNIYEEYLPISNTFDNKKKEKLIKQLFFDNQARNFSKLVIYYKLFIKQDNQKKLLENEEFDFNI